MTSSQRPVPETEAVPEPEVVPRIAAATDDGAIPDAGRFADTGGVDPSWRRLSPRMLLVHPVQEVIRLIPAIVLLIFFGRGSGNEWWGVASLPVVIGIGMSRWFTTTYRITPDYVQVRKGLLRRKELSVPRDRIRTVDVTSHAMHRIMGLARVTVGTGRSDLKDEGVRLDGLTVAEAARLRVELLHLRPGTGTPAPERKPADAGAPEPADPEVEIAVLQPGWIRYGPFTLSGFVAIGVVAAFLSRLVNEAHIDPTTFGPLRTVTEHLTHVGIAIAVAEVVLVCLAVVAVASTLGYVMAFWGFRLTRHSAGTLHVTRGLITSRATTIEERRLRGLELSEPLLLRAAGGARLIAIATGLRVGRGAERGGTLLLPPSPRAEAVRVGTAILGDRQPVDGPLTEHGPAARRRRYTRALSVASVVVGILAVADWLAGGPAWAWQVGLLLVPVAALLARDRYASLGHALTTGHLVSRQGSLVRRRSALARDGIIGWNVRQSFFQRRAGLATLTATTAAGRQHYEVPDVDVHEAVRLADEATPGLLDPFLVTPPPSPPPAS
jgi:putative membrane protein